MAFYARAVRDTAADAVQTARELSSLAAKDRERILRTGRQGPVLHTVHALFAAYLIQNIKNIAAKTGLVPNTVAKALETMTTMGMVTESTGKKRGRVFVYQSYFDILNRVGLG